MIVESQKHKLVSSFVSCWPVEVKTANSQPFLASLLSEVRYDT